MGGNRPRPPRGPRGQGPLPADRRRADRPRRQGAPGRALPDRHRRAGRPAAPWRRPTRWLRASAGRGQGRGGSSQARGRAYRGPRGPPPRTATTPAGRCRRGSSQVVLWVRKGPRNRRWRPRGSFASSGVISTTRRPPPSRGMRRTIPRPSLVTSSGPSPVLGFIAAIGFPLPVGVELLLSARVHASVFTPGRASIGTHYRGNFADCEIRPSAIRHTGLRARSLSPLRPLRRPPAVAWRVGAHLRGRRAARNARHQRPRGAHGRVTSGARGLARAGRARRARVCRDRAGPRAPRGGALPDLPDAGARVGRPLARRGGRAPAGPQRPGQVGAGLGLPRLRRPGPGHLGRAAREPRACPPSCSERACTTTRSGPSTRARNGRSWAGSGTSRAWPRHTSALPTRPVRLGSPTDPSEAFAARSALVHAWRLFLFSDPGLPDEVLPQRWPGREAAALFDRQAAGSCRRPVPGSTPG